MRTALRSSAQQAPALRYLAARHWGPLSVLHVRADAGRHSGPALPEHRLMLYLSPGVAAHCACAGIRRGGRLAPGEFDLVPAGADGCWEDAEPVELVSVRLAPALLAATAEALGRPAGGLSPRLRAHDPRVEPLVRALMTGLRAPEAGARLWAESLGEALAVRLLDGDPCEAPGGLGPRQVRGFAEYVEAHLGEDLSLARLAAVAGVSPSHLTALVRRATGRTPHRFVVERRVARACDLLRRTELPAAQVAAEAGFAHQTHMTRWMRRLAGATPSQLRGRADGRSKSR